MRRALQPVYINEIAFDALIESEESYSATAPAYPTEDGFSVTDTMIVDPLELSLTLFVTATPVTWREENGEGWDKVEEVVNDLVGLFRSKSIVTVETTDKTYTDMVITSMTITKSTDVGYAREIPVTLTQITTTETRTDTVPDSYALSGQTMASTGTAGTGSGGAVATANRNSTFKNLTALVAEEKSGSGGAFGKMADYFASGITGEAPSIYEKAKQMNVRNQARQLFDATKDKLLGFITNLSGSTKVTKYQEKTTVFGTKVTTHVGKNGRMGGGTGRSFDSGHSGGGGGHGF